MFVGFAPFKHEAAEDMHIAVVVSVMVTPTMRTRSARNKDLLHAKSRRSKAPDDQRVGLIE